MTQTRAKDAVVHEHHANQWSINICLASGVCDSLAGPKVGETGITDRIASPHAAQKDLKVGQGFPWLPRDGWADACACPSPRFVLREGVLPCSAGSREGSCQAPSPGAGRAQLGSTAEACCFG